MWRTVEELGLQFQVTYEMASEVLWGKDSKGKPGRSFGEKTAKETPRSAQTAAHLQAQADGRFCEAPSLPLEVLLLLFEEGPLFFEALLLLQQVAVPQQGRGIVVTGGGQLLLLTYKAG